MVGKFVQAEGMLSEDSSGESLMVTAVEEAKEQV